MKQEEEEENEEEEEEEEKEEEEEEEEEEEKGELFGTPRQNIAMSIKDSVKKKKQQP